MLPPQLRAAMRAAWRFIWPYESVTSRHMAIVAPGALALGAYALRAWLLGPDYGVQQAVEIAPALIAFVLLVMLFEQDAPLRPGRRSLAAAGLLFFIPALIFMSQALLALAVLCCCFIYISPRDFLARCRAMPRASAVALIAAGSAKAYGLLSVSLWKYMSAATAWLIFQMLRLLGIDVNYTVELTGNIIRLHTGHYYLNVHQPCSGLEGIFLFFFLYSCVMLIDWKWFVRQQRNDLFLIGAIYMFIFNALRILALYLFASWATHPQASELARSMRGWPLELFHSMIGWTLYLVAFGIFIVIFYRLMGRSSDD